MCTLRTSDSTSEGSAAGLLAAERWSLVVVGLPLDSAQWTSASAMAPSS